MDEMYEAGGDDATDFREYQAASHDALQLENRIIATRALSNADREAKLQFLHESGFIGDAHGNPPTGDLKELVAMIVQLDSETARVIAG
jgi:hypothetical protein